MIWKRLDNVKEICDRDRIMTDYQVLPITSNDWTVIDYLALLPLFIEYWFDCAGPPLGNRWIRLKCVRWVSSELAAFEPGVDEMDEVELLLLLLELELEEELELGGVGKNRWAFLLLLGGLAESLPWLLRVVRLLLLEGQQSEVNEETEEVEPEEEAFG